MTTFEPTLDSLRGRRIPAWYDDAKFGIFIHWGMWAIPAFAASRGSIAEAFRDHYETAVARTPYTEWYENAIKVAGTPSAEFHRQNYGDAPYEAFREPFLETVAKWDPDAWAEVFKSAGARYVVLVTKHHDGFCLWPTAIANPNRENWHTERDVVGELAAAVRARGMRFGVYYSGGIDWSFNREPLKTLGDFVGSVPGGTYPAYADAQTRELIDRYEPSVLWNDISWPAPLEPQMRLFADYYNAVPEGVVNDRWMPVSWFSKLMRFKPARRLFDRAVKKRLAKETGSKGITPPKPPHFDFRTPEYMTFDAIQTRKWEATRGLSHSFGFNREDTDADYLSPEELIHGFIDTVSKNGNLLLNVGPRGTDGVIPPEQVARLTAVGEWLAANGEAIYGTRPWVRAEGETACGLGIRYVEKGSTLYAHVLGQPDGDTLTIRDLAASEATQVDLLGHGPVAFRQPGADLAIDWPGEMRGRIAYALAFTPRPGSH